MKNTIKLFAALAIVLGFAVNAMAQQSDNGQIQAAAEISAQVNVTALQDLIFGVVTPGVTKTIKTDGTVATGALAGTGATVGAEKAGKFSVTKGANTQVVLSFGTLPTNLSDGTNNLPINFVTVGSNILAKLGANTGGQTDLSFVPATGVTTANTGATAEYFAGSDFFVYIGGTVVPASTQVAGVYTGNIILTATYN